MVSEAVEGEYLEKGHVYISKGGAHLRYEDNRGRARIHYTDEPTREGVKPCANYMYESLANSTYHSILCVVLTGMGHDGTEGIQNLVKNKVDLDQTRNIIIVSVVLTLGIGGAILPMGSFSLSGIGLSALAGVILNLVIPKKS